MKKILMVIGQLGFGGAERQLLYLLKGLDRRRFDPLLCALSPGEMIPEFRAIGVPIVILQRYLPRYDIFPLLNLVALTRRWRPHLIHSFLTIANIFAFLSSRICHVPLLVSEKSAAPLLATDVNRFHDWLERLAFSKSEAIMTNSRAGAAQAMTTKGAPPEKVHVVPNGINLENFNISKSYRAVRQKLGLDPDRFTIGIIGSIVGPPKDHETFLQAMQRLSQGSGADFQVVCVGGGHKLEETRSLAGKLGLGERTFFTGVRTDIPEILVALDLVLSSSQWEGMSNVIMEAMAAGKPVVATEVGGTPELVIHGKTGFLVPPLDPVAMAAATQKIMESPKRAGEMGVAGRKRMEKFFSIEKMVRDTENLYHHLLS